MILVAVRSSRVELLPEPCPVSTPIQGCVCKLLIMLLRSIAPEVTNYLADLLLTYHLLSMPAHTLITLQRFVRESPHLTGDPSKRGCFTCKIKGDSHLPLGPLIWSLPRAPCTVQ